MAVLPPHVVIDDFLPGGLHDDLLGYVLAREDGFAPAAVRRGAVDYSDRRRAWTRPDLGDLRAPFREAIVRHLPQLFAGLGMEPFEPALIELELSAHRNGDFFRPHVDTFVGKQGDEGETDRVVTAVYYFHAQPRGFTGGEFAIHPFGEGEPVIIEPRDNRLLAIPAFAIHEVRPIACPCDAFRSARFAVNVWLNRESKGRG
jgi:Rps23 Pro-64 3,4-dihydroxylase Tpa1-like proline 4-hydroxylase